MKIKRLFASLTAGFDDFVSQVENHEAVASSMVEAVRRDTARIKVQLNRTEAQARRAGDEAREHNQQASRWRERAAGLTTQEREKALECLRRARVSTDRAETVEAQGAALLCAGEALRADLSALEAKLGELRMRRTTLASRSARAGAGTHLGAARTESPDEAFDRWEAQVAEAEYASVGSASVDIDPLDREFSDAETLADLEAELDELTRQRHPG